MFKNYLITAIRSFKRNSFHSILNLLGLGFGTAIFIIVLLYARHELSYDKFNENYSRIFRLDNIEKGVKWSSSNGLIGPEITDAIPEITAFTRSDSYKSRTIKYEENVINLNKIVYHDSSVFKIFTYNFIQGDPQTALQSPLTMVLTKSTAKRIFGDEDPINKIVTVDEKYQFTITGVVEDLPFQSHVQPEALISIENLIVFTNDEDALKYEGQWNYYTYLLLEESADIASVNEKVKDYFNKKYEITDDKLVFTLTSLHNVYFEPAENYVLKQGNLNQVYIFLAIGLVVLVIAIINYFNLSTAQALTRSKELGLRKVVGSNRQNIIFQLIAEAIFLSLIAVNISLIFVELLKHRINDLLNIQIFIGYFDSPWVLISILLFGVFVGMISGVFPALYISRFDTLKSINKGITHGRLGQLLRQSLIVIQFFIATILVVSTLVIAKQMNYMQKYDLGFDKEQLMYVKLNRDLYPKKEIFKKQITEHAGIENMSYSYASYRLSYERWGTQIDSMNYTCHIELCDFDYVETLGLEIVEGRDFNYDLRTDTGNVLINEAAAKKLFNGNALGKDIYGGKVVGIVKNYSFETLHNEVEPIAIILHRYGNIASIRFKTGEEKEVLRHLNKVWNELSPNYTLEYHFINDYYEGKYQKELQSRKLFLIISICAIAIACLGVIGLISFSIQRRMKEIGIRKVNGAFASNVMVLLSREVTQLILIASIVAIPVSWYLMNNWLQGFAYRISVPFYVFPVSFVLIWIISIFSIAYQTAKVSRLDPVKVLRYE